MSPSATPARSHAKNIRIPLNYNNGPGVTPGLFYYVLLILCVYLYIIKVAGVRLPAHCFGFEAVGCGGRPPLFFIYSFIMRLTLSLSSSSVSHFSMSSRIAFNNASVMFISFIHLAPFCKRFCISALQSYYTSNA